MFSAPGVSLPFAPLEGPLPGQPARPAAPAFAWPPRGRSKPPFPALPANGSGNEDNAAVAAEIGTGEQCVLFPTYAYRTPAQDGCGPWKVKVSGWCYTTKGAGSRTHKVAMDIFRRVMGVPKNDTTGASELLRSRAAMFLASNSCETDIALGVAGLASLDEFYAKPLGKTAPSVPGILTPSETKSTPEPGLSEKFAPTSVSADKRRGDGAVEELKIRATGHFDAELTVRDEVVRRWSESGAADPVRMMLRLVAVGAQLQNPSFGYADLVEPEGVSVISDIDDTIKETNVSLGKRVVLNNTFLTEAREIAGMANVYSHWWTRGFAMHYVSNTPYQLLPMLDAFFRCHGFPPGSTHLKIFDWRGPSRTSILSNPELGKRRHILSILKDFPKRKFILVGDSGERDLELYTKIARENPGRVLKIFIRDVTTPRLRRQMQDEAASATASPRRTFPLQLTRFEAIRHRTLNLRSKPWSSPSAAPVSTDESSPDKEYADFPSADRCALTEDVPPNSALRHDLPQTHPSSTASSPASSQLVETWPLRFRRRSLTELGDCFSPMDAVPNGSTGSGTAEDHRLEDVNNTPPSVNCPGVPAVAAPVPQTANERKGQGEASPAGTMSPTADAGYPPPPLPRRARSPANPLAAFARRIAEATEGLPEGMCTLFEDSERLLLDESLQARLKEYRGS